MTDVSPSGSGPGGGDRLTLPARMDRRASEALLAQMRAAQGGNLRIDAGAVECLCAQGLQTLLVGARAWDSTGHTFLVENVSDAMAAQLANFGIPESAWTGEVAECA